MRKWLKLLCFTILLFTAFWFKPLAVLSQECDRLCELNKKVDEYQKELTRLQSQANTLSNQIAQFNAQISLTEAKIRQTEEKILLLGGRIDQLELSLGSLTDAFSSRAVETYKMTRFGDSLFFVFSGKDLSEVVSRFKYLQKIQEADRGLLVRLQKAQNAYTAEKTDQEELQGDLEEQTKVLGVQKEAKAQLLSVTKSDEQKYQELLAQAKAQLASLSRFAESVGISLLPHQDLSDGWGKYYNQRDSQWGNLLINGDTSDCRGGSCTLARVGCLVTSYAMVVSHYGGSALPSDIATTPSYFYLSTADFNYPGPSANGHSVERVDNPSAQSLKDALNSGKVVIAGLSSNGGPYPQHYSDHWIVLRSVDGDNFKINDPLYPGAMNVSFNDHYSGWAIIQARIYN